MPLEKGYQLDSWLRWPRCHQPEIRTGRVYWFAEKISSRSMRQIYWQELGQVESSEQ